MRMVACEECKKRYDFDTDEFCPRCGAFNPPPKQWTVDNCGNVVRVDGVNERNHSGSFVHDEVHREKAIRRIKGLDRGGVKPAKVSQPIKEKTFQTGDKVKYVLEKMLAYVVSIMILSYLFGLLFGLR